MGERRASGRGGRRRHRRGHRRALVRGAPRDGTASPSPSSRRTTSRAEPRTGLSATTSISTPARRTSSGSPRRPGRASTACGRCWTRWARPYPTASRYTTRSRCTFQRESSNASLTARRTATPSVDSRATTRWTSGTRWRTRCRGSATPPSPSPSRGCAVTPESRSPWPNTSRRSSKHSGTARGALKALKMPNTSERTSRFSSTNTSRTNGYDRYSTWSAS